MINLLLLALSIALGLNVALRLLRKSPRIAFLFFAFFSITAIAGYINAEVLTFYEFDRDWSYLSGRAHTLMYSEAGLFQLFQEVRGRSVYSILIMISFQLFGESPTPLVMLNSFLSALAIVLTYQIAMEFGADRKHAFVAALVVAFFPTSVAYAVQPSREALVLFGSAAGLYYVLRYLRTGRVYNLFVSAPALLIAAVLHSAMSIFLIGLFWLAAFSSSNVSAQVQASPSSRRAKRYIFGFLFVLPMLVLFVLSGAGFAKLGGGFSAIDEDLLQSRFISADLDNRASYFSSSELRQNSLTDHLLSTPKRIFLFSAKPFPTDIGSAQDLVAVVLNVAAVAFVVLLLRTPKKDIRANYRGVIVSLCAVVFVILAMGTNNWGTAVRHKNKLFIPSVAIAAAVLSDRRRRREVVLPRAALAHSHP